MRFRERPSPARTAPWTFAHWFWPTVGLVAVVGACWAYLIHADWAMRHMDAVEMAMPSAAAWSRVDFALVGTMWVVMMVAMMVPSVVPALLVHRQVVRSRGPFASRDLQSAMFLLGYVLVWTGFSALVTIVQWWLHNALVVSPSMTITRPAVAAMLMIAAGLYQWTPLKGACLTRCRSPLSFLVQHWHDGKRGALRMGVVHGAYCTGCCWLLMALLFVYGVMNLVWIVAITAVVLAEKMLPPNRWFHRALGAILVGWGVIVLVSA